MALWQFTLDLLPSSAAVINGMAAARMSRDQVQLVKMNFSEAMTKVLLEHVCRMLPEIESWHETLRIWGDEKTDDVQISFDGTIVEDVQFRLNVSDLSLPLIGSICELAREMDCVLATRQGAIVRPNIEAVARAITRSNASCFVKDPDRFLLEDRLESFQAD